ncbi:trafficking protein particle complex subunit 10 [Condylostylus longicornis]|uniref:trafficking protein particle complex subunit 10 n=1 Tax=Condylostylus longicornis TaxID=2530218 RepID=UPI00244DCB4A|nr:trafficking protein particle complex subunit 10 [Condylostylus longicornis]
MNSKPVLTYSGVGPLFKSLEPHIVSSIPLDTCEWRRAFGRPSKNVRLEAVFQPFSETPLEKFKKGEWSIQEHPVLHIFITECADVDTYKNSVKEEIDAWLKVLNTYYIADWMILLVETIDARKTKNIIPRTTVLDKIRLDFASKNGDRCISVLNPAKFEQKSTESFRCLVQRIRHLMLSSYSKNIVKYEELIRVNREKRNHENWDFIKYFLLQEDLALILEKLELHSEALIQYDELDAMFSQFVTNSGFGEKQKWLESFQHSSASFHGISLHRQDKFSIREKIKNVEVTFLEFRNYLFERQAHLLILMEKHAEIADRLLPFLFGTIREIEVLKVDVIEGALSCWQFVCSLEVLDVCDQVMESNQVECFKKCAPIWNLAKDKLYDLGKLCGLLPGFTPSSEQLHIVVQLSAGIGDAPNAQNFLDPTPQIEKSHSPSRKPKKSSTEKLKEALGSNQGFQKLYLELSELAISTYKHVSRLRSARLVGLDLGNFYCALNEPHKAVVFFTDLLRELKAESWTALASQTLLELANCFRKMEDLLAYTKTCCTISCCLDLEVLVRTFYFDEFLKSLKNLPQILKVENDANPYFCILEEHFKICAIDVLNEGIIIQDDMVIVQVKLESNFPREIYVDKILLSYEMSSNNNANDLPSVDSISNNCFLNSKQEVFLHLEYKQDNTLSSASVRCDVQKSSKPVRRTSSTRRKISPTIRADFTNCFAVDPLVIHPGNNLIELKGKALRVGIWNFKQLSIKMRQLEFLSDKIPIKLKPFEFTTKAASAILCFKNLIAGIEQPVTLFVSGGSFIFPPDAKITLKCSKHLKIRPNIDSSEETKFENLINCPLPNFKSFEERTIPLIVLTDLPGCNTDKHIEHAITLNCPWSRNDLDIPLHFMPAMTASCRLHTCNTQKFLHVCLKGLEAHLILSGTQMKCDTKGVNLVDLNPKSQKTIEIYKNLTVSFLWELQVEPLKTENEMPVIKVHFSTKYASYNKPDVQRNYACAFDVRDYTTLFKIQAKIESNELCRVGSVCNLNLKITKMHDNPYNDLMYEVLADQNMWAVCGRTAGVVSMNNVESHSISLDVLPLSVGFLPMPNVRLSKYISGGKNKQDVHPKLQPFPPGQVYNSTKSMQIHVLAGTTVE